MGHPLSGLRYHRMGISSTQKVIYEAFAWGKVSGQSSECRDLTMIIAPLPPTLVRGNFHDSLKLEDKACRIDASIGKFGSSLYLTRWHRLREYWRKTNHRGSASGANV